MPSVITLAAACILLAAKMNEPISPNMKNMVFLITHMQPGSLTLNNLIQLERHIICQLDFDIQSQCSISFLERFCQLFLIDDGLFARSETEGKAPSAESTFNQDVCRQATELCLQAQRSTKFLSFKPAEIAAASLMISLNALS